MMTDMYFTETDILVPFHDVDSMDVVWHGHYAKYFEVARCEFLDVIGYGYKAMRDSGYTWPIIDMRTKYIKSIRFGQKISVHCSLREWEYRLKLEYIIRDAVTGEKLTTGYTCQAAVDMTTGDMCFESPAILLQHITQHYGKLPA